MRSLIAVTASIAMLVAQVPLVPAFGQSAPPAPLQAATTQYPVVADTFKAFPSGGDPLSSRIADLVTANPKLAAEFVIYMRNAEGLTRAQKVAAEQGLAAAADRLGIKAAVRDNDDAWFVALAILAVGAATCIAACQRNNNNNGNGAVFVSAN